MESPAVLDGRAVALWARACASRLTACKQEINALNVFPVPDSDTGSNMAFTMQSAVDALADVPADASTSEVAAALATGATAGARGNSGLVISQILRGLADASREGPIDAQVFHSALRQAQEFVHSAIADPVEGTVITVLRSAVNAVDEYMATESAATDGAQAESTQQKDIDPAVTLHTVVSIAHQAAHFALQRTPSQLAVLRHAGVVDAGGRGLLVIIETLDDLLTRFLGSKHEADDSRVNQWVEEYFQSAGDPDYNSTDEYHVSSGAEADKADGADGADNANEGATSLADGDNHPHSHAHSREHGHVHSHDEAHGSSEIFGIEVMFQIRGANTEDVRNLLTSMGDSVVVVPVSDDELTAHVHTESAGPLIEAAAKLGEVSNLRLEVLHTQSSQPSLNSAATTTANPMVKPTDTRCLVTLVSGSEWAETFRRAGGVPVVVNHLDPSGVRSAAQEIPSHLVPTMLSAVIRPVLDPQAQELIIVTNGCCSQQALVAALQLTSAIQPGIDQPGIDAEADTTPDSSHDPISQSKAAAPATSEILNEAPQRWQWPDSEAEVIILDTSSMLAGLAALAVHDPSLSPVDDVASMAEAAQDVTTIIIRDDGDELYCRRILGAGWTANSTAADTEADNQRVMTKSVVGQSLIEYCTELFREQIAGAAELVSVVVPSSQLSADIEAVALQLQQDVELSGEWEMTITEVPGCGAIYVGCE